MKIADNVELDLDAMHGQRQLLMGASGSGKSNTARVLLEAAYGRFQEIILDTEDEFHTLRTEGREYAILGGDHGDAPLTPKQDAGELAQTLLRIGVNVVLQIGDWTLQEKRYFVGQFIAGMMRAKSDLWHPVIVMLDETHQFAPQATVVDSSEAVTHLATAGRKRGYGAIFATQRISLISKDVMGQCENKFLGRVEQSIDRRAVADLLGFTPRQQEAVDMQTFAAGEFYVVGPALTKVPTRAKLYKAATEAPKPGTTVLPSATPAAISKALAALAKASEPEPAPAMSAEAKAIAIDWGKMKKEAYDAGYAQGVNDGRKQGYTDGRSDAGRLLMRKVQEFVLENADADADGGLTVPETIAPVVREALKEPQVIAASPNKGTIPLSPSSKKVVEAIIAAFPLGMTLERAAKRAGLSSRSSAFRRYLQEAAADPRIEMRTNDGRYYALQPDGTITAPAGLAAFKEKLPPSFRRMLEVIQNSQAPMTREDVGHNAYVSITSSGLNAGLKELVALGLIEYAGNRYILHPDFKET